MEEEEEPPPPQPRRTRSQTKAASMPPAPPSPPAAPADEPSDTLMQRLLAAVFEGDGPALEALLAEGGPARALLASDPAPALFAGPQPTRPPPDYVRRSGDEATDAKRRQKVIGGLWTPLGLAAFLGDAGAVERLVKAGSCPERLMQGCARGGEAGCQGTQPEETTALLLALGEGQSAAALALLRGGADASRRMPDGRTPLLAAVDIGGVDVIDHMLNERDFIYDMLHELDVKPAGSVGDGIEQLGALGSESTCVTHTPVMLAAERFRDRLVYLRNQRDQLGDTWRTHYVERINLLWANTEQVLGWLVEAAGTANDPPCWRGGQLHSTALEMCLQANSLVLVQQLLDHGAVLSRRWTQPATRRALHELWGPHMVGPLAQGVINAAAAEAIAAAAAAGGTGHHSMDPAEVAALAGEPQGRAAGEYVGPIPTVEPPQPPAIYWFNDFLAFDWVNWCSLPFEPPPLPPWSPETHWLYPCRFGDAVRTLLLVCHRCEGRVRTTRGGGPLPRLPPEAVVLVASHLACEPLEMWWTEEELDWTWFDKLTSRDDGLPVSQPSPATS